MNLEPEGFEDAEGGVPVEIPSTVLEPADSSLRYVRLFGHIALSAILEDALLEDEGTKVLGGVHANRLASWGGGVNNNLIV